MQRFCFVCFCLVSQCVFSTQDVTRNFHQTAKHSTVSGFEAKDYSFLLGKLRGIHDDLLKMHFTLYQGYVKTASELHKLLEMMRLKGEDKTITYGALERRFAWEFDGMVLHEYYFDNMGPSPPLQKSDPLYCKIVEDFGSIDKFLQNFAATGMMRGIGWVILYQNPQTGQLNNVWIDEHNINHFPGGKPLLIMDVWEHAYLTQFGLNRGSYIRVFIDNINWERVSMRFDEGISLIPQPSGQ